MEDCVIITKVIKDSKQKRSETASAKVIVIDDSDDDCVGGGRTTKQTTVSSGTNQSDMSNSHGRQVQQKQPSKDKTSEKTSNKCDKLREIYEWHQQRNSQLSSASNTYGKQSKQIAEQRQTNNNSQIICAVSSCKNNNKRIGTYDGQSSRNSQLLTAKRNNGNQQSHCRTNKTATTTKQNHNNKVNQVQRETDRTFDDECSPMEIDQVVLGESSEDSMEIIVDNQTNFDLLLSGDISLHTETDTDNEKPAKKKRKRRPKSKKKRLEYALDRQLAKATKVTQPTEKSTSKSIHSQVITTITESTGTKFSPQFYQHKRIPRNLPIPVHNTSYQKDGANISRPAKRIRTEEPPNMSISHSQDSNATRPTIATGRTTLSSSASHLAGSNCLNNEITLSRPVKCLRTEEALSVGACLSKRSLLTSAFNDRNTRPASSSKFASECPNSFGGSSASSVTGQIALKKKRKRRPKSSKRDKSVKTFDRVGNVDPPNDEKLQNMKHILMVDLDNWQGILKSDLPIAIGTFVWGFHGGSSQWVPPMNSVMFQHLLKNQMFYLHPRCGTSKDAADFALCIQAGKLDMILPKSIPFTVLSGDTGFMELRNQLARSNREVHIVDPHHKTIDMVLAMLNSITEK